MKKSYPNYSVMVLFLSFLGTALVPTLSPQPNTPANIEIIRPVNNSTVGQFGNDIEFRSNSPISNSYVPVVFIKDPINQWWPWLQSIPVAENNMNWRLNNVQIGSISGYGQRFQIQVLVIPRQHIDNGIVLSAEESLFIVGGESISNRIFVTVLREGYPTQSDIVTVVRE